MPQHHHHQCGLLQKQTLAEGLAEHNAANVDKFVFVQQPAVHHFEHPDGTLGAKEVVLVAVQLWGRPQLSYFATNFDSERRTHSNTQRLNTLDITQEIQMTQHIQQLRYYCQLGTESHFLRIPHHLCMTPHMICCNAQESKMKGQCNNCKLYFAICHYFVDNQHSWLFRIVYKLEVNP
jgi:hypothetical protein